MRKDIVIAALILAVSVTGSAWLLAQNGRWVLGPKGGSFDTHTGTMCLPIERNETHAACFRVHPQADDPYNRVSALDTVKANDDGNDGDDPGT